MDSNKSFGIAGRASNAFTVSRRARGMNSFRAVDSTFVSKVTRKFSVEDSMRFMTRCVSRRKRTGSVLTV